MFRILFPWPVTDPRILLSVAMDLCATLNCLVVLPRCLQGQSCARRTDPGMRGHLRPVCTQAALDILLQGRVSNTAVGS